jgi:hypothetical protein
MGKSHFKIAADLVIDNCLEHGYQIAAQSNYYWAYVEFFTEINSKFDRYKFDEYINKRI